LLALGYRIVPPLAVEILIWATYITTIASGIDYGVVWGSKFRQEIVRRAATESQKKKQDS